MGHISTLASLQKLILAGSGQPPITPAALPGIEHLTALKALSIWNCDHLEPSCLLPLTTGLTSLWLSGNTLQPPEYSPLGASQLQEVLARLTALRHLDLGRCRYQHTLP